MTWAFRTSLTLDLLDLRLAVAAPPGLLGLAEEAGLATAYFSERVPVAIEGDWEEMAEQDWHAAWKVDLRPVRVGQIVVRAPWHPAQDGIDLVIDPGQAFGTGHHETTTGCLAALQELELSGRTVLDVGTGSGILAIAAALLGARRVQAVDTDRLAVEAAAENARRNGVDDRVTVAEGSLPLAVAGGDERFDVVVANLDTATVTALAAGLAAAVRRGGTLVVSGVSIARLPEAQRALHAARLAVWARTGAEWAVLTAR